MPEPKIDVQIPPIKESHVQDQEFGNTIHLASIGETVPRECIWKPEYWANVAKRFKPGDEVKMFYEDSSYWAWALVLSANPSGVVLKKIMDLDMDTVKVREEDMGLYTVKFKGRFQKWVVIRKSDNEMISSGISQKVEALKQAQQLNDGE